VEIVSGLNPGDQVVIEGTTKIRSGSIVAPTVSKAGQ
jgi:membrane fusion protein (multidrug efflux system)